MKLFEDFDDAKEALEAAYRIMSNDENTRRRRLSAMLMAFEAERSIELINQQPYGANFADPDPEFWQRRYDEVKAFYDAYVAAERRANEASLRAYLNSLKSSFDDLPGELKKAMDASFHPVYGWNFITEY
jgi:hypothetical protein